MVYHRGFYDGLAEAVRSGVRVFFPHTPEPP